MLFVKVVRKRRKIIPIPSYFPKSSYFLFSVFALCHCFSFFLFFFLCGEDRDLCNQSCSSVHLAGGLASMAKTLTLSANVETNFFGGEAVPVEHFDTTVE